tara:strand:+ start:136 stop:471 length:336 start_codon:yes stop_codon:yes gene_type:complete
MIYVKLNKKQLIDKSVKLQKSNNKLTNSYAEVLKSKIEKEIRLEAVTEELNEATIKNTTLEKENILLVQAQAVTELKLLRKIVALYEEKPKDVVWGGNGTITTTSSTGLRV